MIEWNGIEHNRVEQSRTEQNSSDNQKSGSSWDSELLDLVAQQRCQGPWFHLESTVLASS